MSAPRQAIAVVVGGLMLAGCQTFGNAPRNFDAGQSVTDQTAFRAQAEQQLAIGRAALERHNYAAAVAALREAALEPEFAAAAHNGLGVAYAGIGRNDLAERYFIQASAEDPAEERYRDNLVRLYRVRLVEEQARRERARLVQEERDFAQAQRRAAANLVGLEAQLPSRQMVRVGPSAVRINSAVVRPEASRIVVQERNPVRVEAPAREAAVPEPEPSPDERSPEPPRVAAAIEGRRVVHNRHTQAGAPPAEVTITSTGRRYRNPAPEAPALADARPRQTGRVAALPAIGPAVVQPMRLRRPIFGDLDLAESTGIVVLNAE